MKRINKIVPAFLNLLKFASYVSLCACSGNQVKDKCIQTAGGLPLEVKEPKNVQNNETEKNLDKLTNLLAACQSCKKGNNKDKCAKDDKETCSSAKHAKAKNHKKVKGSNGNSSARSKQKHKSSISDLTTTPILQNHLSIDFDVTGKLTINDSLYEVTNENEFKVFLEYLERAKNKKKSINGLDSIFPKAEKVRKGNNDSVRLWKKDWFWKSINAHWDLFKDLNLQNFSIKSSTDTTNKEKIYIEDLGITDFLFSDVVNKPLDGKKEKTVAEIKDEYNKVFQIKTDHTRKKK